MTRRQTERLDRQLELLALSRAARGHDIAYGAHLRLRTSAGEMDVLLGSGEGLLRGEPAPVLRVDWPRSVYTAVFLGCREGERFEVRRNGRIVRGTLLERNRVRLVRGELVEVSAERVSLVRDEDGVFRALPRAPTYFAASAAAERRPGRTSLVDVELDPAQRGAVCLPLGRPLLVLGEAGRGKTTVALHRLAHLDRVARANGDRFRAVVIVPTEGLKWLADRALAQLGVDVPVLLYEQWARAQARRAFAELPRRESSDATAGVLRIKRDPALRLALERLSRRRAGRFGAPHGGARSSGPLADRADLLHLFGDRALLDEVVAASRQRIPPHALGELLEHTHVQFSKTTEEEFSHVVDRERLVPVDGRTIDVGTPMNDAGSIDAEDYAVLFELDRMRAEARGRPATPPRVYDCVVLDEAQELAPLELKLIGRSLAPGGTLVVAGDSEQHTDLHAAFTGWEAAMTELGRPDFETVVLGIDYRCPPVVARLARWVRDPLGHGESGRADRTEGEPPAWRSCPSELHLVDEVAREVRALRARTRRASIALVCRSPLVARRLADLLKLAVPARLVLGGEFPRSGGTFVTTVEQSKGLEFDYVVLPDASEGTYPDELSSRRALYVAMTRARTSVLFLGVGRVPPALRGGPLTEGPEARASG